MGLASKLAAAGPAVPAAPSSSIPTSYGQSGAVPSAPSSTYPGQQPQQSQSGQYGYANEQSSYPGQRVSQYSQQQQPNQYQYGSSAGQQSGYTAPSGPPPTGARPVSYGQAPAGYASPSGAPPPYGQSGPGGYGQSQQPNYGQSQQPSYGQPQQSSYGQSQNGYGQPPPSHQYGIPTQSQQYGGYGAQLPGVSSGGDARAILSVLQQCAQEQNITVFYPQGSLEPIAQRVAQSGALDRVAREWRMPKEIASDLAKLALFDIILYVDDSGSMAFEQGGERIDDLKLILNRVAYASSLFDADGIQVRFMNSNIDGDGIRDEQSAAALLQRIKFSGLTPLGTAMDKKILQPLVLGPARAGRLAKPVLIITITDGAPAGEDRHHIAKVIMNANRELQRTRYGADAISFQFAQVGNDQKAQAFLAELDNHREIGGLVDVTSNYELESEEMQRKSGQELTPELWLVKMLMGGIDNSYDEKDE